MNEILIYIPLDDYLADWFVNEQGGSRPVKLMKGSVESGLLEQFLQVPPRDFIPRKPEEGRLAIIIPSFRHKSPLYYNYLPPRAMEALISCIRQRFDICLWQSIHRFSSVFHRKDNLIYAFMEKHHIEMNEKNWNAIAKRYQRKRDYYLMNERRKKLLKDYDFIGPLSEMIRLIRS